MPSLKDKLPQYIDLLVEEKKDIFDGGTIIFDANVLLNLYRYSKKTRDDLLGVMRDFKKRLWIPYQVAEEYLRNRYEVIFEVQNRHEKLLVEADKLIKTICSTLRVSNSEKEISVLSDYIKNWIHAKKEEDVLDATYENDAILDEINHLYLNSVGDDFTEEDEKKIRKEGEERYKDKIPPGYMDQNKESNKYGDFRLWKQILKYANLTKKDVLFITDDQKEDWWQSYQGKKVGPRSELRKEYSDNSEGKDIWFYTVDQFLNMYNNKNDNKIANTTIDEVKSLQKQQEFKGGLADDSAGNINDIHRLMQQRKKLQKELEIYLNTYLPIFHRYEKCKFSKEQAKIDETQELYAQLLKIGAEINRRQEQIKEINEIIYAINPTIEKSERDNEVWDTQ